MSSFNCLFSEFVTLRADHRWRYSTFGIQCMCHRTFSCVRTRQLPAHYWRFARTFDGVSGSGTNRTLWLPAYYQSRDSKIEGNLQIVISKGVSMNRVMVQWEFVLLLLVGSRTETCGTEKKARGCYTPQPTNFIFISTVSITNCLSNTCDLRCLQGIPGSVTTWSRPDCRGRLWALHSLLPAPLQQLIQINRSMMLSNLMSINAVGFRSGLLAGHSILLTWPAEGKCLLFWSDGAWHYRLVILHQDGSAGGLE